MIDARADINPPTITAKVLVVEDEPPLAELLRYNLEAAGYTVQHAHSGEEAEVLVSEEPPDLVLLDWMLPETSGLEFCRRLRVERDKASSHHHADCTWRGKRSHSWPLNRR